ncbi:hypothetical protein Vi05172_g1694 [Venturia inaequalis]|nr:hypothetical protein Vi05172_g1694 [Venturia inaequalis]
MRVGSGFCGIIGVTLAPLAVVVNMEPFQLDTESPTLLQWQKCRKKLTNK